MYKFKNEVVDKKFLSIGNQIKSNTDAVKTIKYLGVRDKFIFNQDRIPYTASIREIEKIQHCDNPVEMIQCLSLSFARLKSEVVDYHKGKFELESMDDVLPLSIYCVVMSNLPHAASYQNMMEDYLR